ncbi:bifunctional nicotinamidase/pyrazinamidase [Erwiniaceae bacterium BAC15a-03b]|uniref:Nicotinamidase n=1 Tax=Winslowiella arboricola TaxID=2978220 RepID=A0A9J6PM36_9GAMM|nr:bifunctional nicotinamidase/pyrazinamidase [Winslowiella arboricola]MCU5775765.1 bifunctional nicotinamidase/pyrazinamidase [Winslowiella arboricola]MCU5779385.1 bifunctional nicotinamidase/pyrazinamidase [Winslowiella arboricola]
MKRALLLIDLQNDFCPGGALAVNDGDATIAVANRLAAEFRQRGDTVIASQDWHPADHGSFASVAAQPAFTEGVLNELPQTWWPDHCIQGSAGAEFHPQLDVSLIQGVFHKGQDAAIDSYSAFFDNGYRRKTALDKWLSRREIQSLLIIGLATDYCVKFSVLDALKLGYQVEVLREGCRGVNLQPDASEQAFAAMAAAGAIIL